MSIESKLAFLQETKAANAQTKAYQRLQLLFDEGTFVEIDSFTKSGDGRAEAAAGFGSVDGCPVYAFAQNSDVEGGAMSKAQACLLYTSYDGALDYPGDFCFFVSFAALSHYADCQLRNSIGG